MKDEIANELEKFVKENPTADTLEIVQHFCEFGRMLEREEIKARRKKEDELPPFYGN